MKNPIGSRIRKFVETCADTSRSIRSAVDSIKKDVSNIGGDRELKYFEITGGNTVSDSIDCRNKQLVAIKPPLTFPGTELQFRGSHDGKTHSLIYAPSGNRYYISIQSSDWTYLDEPMATLPFRYIKIESNNEVNVRQTVSVILRHLS